MGNKQVKPEEGRWVEYLRSTGFNQQGNEHFEGTGRYFWEGPEPKNGIYPPNPGETPAGILKLEKIKKEANNAAKRKEISAARNKMREQNAQYALDEQSACKTACDKAVQELRNMRKSTQSAGRRKMKKYKQKRRKTYRVR